MEHIVPFLVGFRADADLLRHLVDLVPGFSHIVCHVPQLFSGSDRSRADGGNSGGHSLADRLCDLTELLELAPGVLRLIPSFVHFLGKLARFIACLVKTVLGVLESLVVILQFTLVKSRFCVVQLNLPVLCTLVVLTEGGGGVVESSL